MTLRGWIARMQQYHIRRQVAQVTLPAFAMAPKVRRRYVFRGRVQGVGFRQELALLAARLEVTGYVCNLPDGRVLAEMQGAAARLDYLLVLMSSLRRIRIHHIQEAPSAVRVHETTFLIL